MITNNHLTTIIMNTVLISIARENNEKIFQNFLILLKYLLEPLKQIPNREKEKEFLIHSSDIYNMLFSNFFLKSTSVQLKILHFTLEV